MKLQASFLALVLAAAPTFAQTAKVIPDPIVPDADCDLYRGTAIIARNQPSLAAARAASERDTVERGASAGYSCRTSTGWRTEFVKAPPPPPPTPTCTTPRPADSQTVQCTAPQTGSFPQTRTVTAAAFPQCWTAGAWQPEVGPSPPCVTPPPTECTNPIPSPESRTQACPAGTTGNPWTQTSTYTRGEPPGCLITQGPWLPAAPRADICIPIIEPPPPTGGPTLHFAPDGVNSNPGTQAAPKANLAGINLNTLARGTTLLFKRGGSWDMQMLDLDNRVVTAAAPLTFGAWGDGLPPVLRAFGPNGVEIGRHNDRPVTGGYVFRGLKIDGRGQSQWGFFLRGSVGVVIEDTEVTGFALGVHSQQTANVRNTGLTLRRANVNRNREMGMLGDADDMVIEDSKFAANNFSGSNFNHGIYLGGSGRNGVIRRNGFDRNSAINGLCAGGNLTVHGQWDGLLIEDNTITQDAARDSCYGLVVNGGYTSREFFRNVVIRRNVITNVGGCAICLNSAPGVLVEQNLLLNLQATYQTGVLLPSSTYEGGDEPESGAVIRDNVICQSAPSPGSVAVNVRSPGGSITGNVYRTGADARTGPCAR